MNHPNQHGESTGDSYDFGSKGEHGEIANPREAVRYRFSPEEMRAMKECNRESFFRRCLPLTAAGMIGLTAAKNAGIVKGPMGWKYASAIFLGYFGGKLSYVSVCKEKLLKIPNSRLAETLRQQQGGTGQIWQEMATMPDVPVSLPSLHPRRDDTFIPGSIQYPEGTSPTEMTEVEPTATPVKLSTTYDELRKKNRDEFMRQQRPYVTRPQDREKIGEPKQFVDHGQDDLSRNPSIGRSRIAQQPTDTKYGDTGFN